MSSSHRPNWENVYRDCVHMPDRDQELVQVTRETARLALVALKKCNREDYYHNFGAATRELSAVVKGKP